MRGLRLFRQRERFATEVWPNDARVYPLLESARELGVPVSLQLQTTELVNLPPLLQRFPKIPLLVEHLANVPPEGVEELLDLTPFSDIRLKFSTQNLRHPDGPAPVLAFFRRLLDGFGAERLMWGSNFPVSLGAVEPYKDLVDEALQFLRGFSAKETELMLGGAAHAVFGPLG